jgi:uncharacterized protein YjbI with pentapeptide repeats
MDPSLAAEAWGRLITGQSLDGLALSTIDRRIDLRTLVVPGPSVVRQYTTTAANVKELRAIVIRGAQWRGIDFSNSQLDSLRFFDTIMDDCVFDGARCRGWRVWGSSISNTTFQKTDLRNSALGGVQQNGARNSFRRVDFSEADLRQTAHKSADMIECTFADTKLTKVDFQGTVFTNCIFAGELNEVQFYRHAFRGEAFPPNEMKGVDLRRAKLHHAEFRGLDMRDVQWPEDDEHLVVNEYPATLDRVLIMLKSRSDVGSKRLAAILGMKRKWAGPNQQRGVLSKRDLVEAAGATAAAEVTALVGDFAS